MSHVNILLMYIYIWKWRKRRKIHVSSRRNNIIGSLRLNRDTPAMETRNTATRNEEQEEQQRCIYATQLVTASVLPMVLNTVIQLQVFEILAKAGPNAQLSASQIVSQLSAAKNPDAAAMLDRMLSILVGASVLTCSISDGQNVQKLYGLAPVAKYFVQNQDGASFGHLMAMFHDKVFIQSWFELKNAVLEGGVPFDRVHGTHAFEYPKTDPRFNDVFNKAMTGYTTFLIKEILEHYKGFENLNKLVDVGGGLGITLNMIISKYPNIKGINFDLPHVINNAPSSPGLEHVGGNMFESVPEGDAIFMKWILHHWSDAHCLKMLKNCYEALPEDGKVIAVEAVFPVKPKNDSSFITTSQFDLFMMTQNPGGKERTEKEFLALATKSGFRGMDMCCLVSNLWVMEFYK